MLPGEERSRWGGRYAILGTWNVQSKIATLGARMTLGHLRAEEDRFPPLLIHPQVQSTLKSWGIVKEAGEPRERGVQWGK